MTNIDDLMIPCLNKKFFGFECMGCGFQRAFSLLLKGEFIEAFFMYPAIYTLIPLFSTILLSFFVKFKYSQKLINLLAITSISIIVISFLIKKLY